MKLKELKDAIDRVYTWHKRADDLEVGIPSNEGGMGGTPITGVRHAGKGIDWDNGKFLIWPDVKMTELKED